MSSGWATYTESEYKLRKKWHFLSGDENATMSLRSRHVSASITSFDGENWIAWSFDGFGWVQLRTWLGFPKNFDGSPYDGVYLVVRAAQKIDLGISVDYRQVEEVPHTDWELRSASVPLHLPRGTVAKVLVPFSLVKLDNPAWVVGKDHSLLAIDRSSLESVGLIVTSHGTRETVYVHEIGFYAIGFETQGKQ